MLCKSFCNLKSRQKQDLCIIDHFHILTESKFIEHLELKEYTDIQNGKKVRNYEKINNRINFANDTILHYAVYEEKELVVDYLMKHQADPNVPNQVRLVF